MESAELHPLVLMNISDHSSRSRNQPGAVRAGILFGEQRGHIVEIFESMELLIEAGEGEIQIDEEFFAERMALMRQFPTALDIVGWYRVDDLDDVGPMRPAANDMELYKFVVKEVVNPLALMVNVRGPSYALYEFDYAEFMREDRKKEVYSEVAFKIASVETERITVQHLSNLSLAENKQSAYDDLQHFIQSKVYGLEILLQRLQVLLDFVRRCRAQRAAGEPLTAEQAFILHNIKSLCVSLPQSRAPAERVQDVSLVSELAMVSKSMSHLKEIREHFEYVQKKK